MRGDDRRLHAHQFRKILGIDALDLADARDGFHQLVVGNKPVRDVRDGPVGQVRGSEQQVLNKAQIVPLGLDAESLLRN